MKISLFENAMDSVEHGIEHLKSGKEKKSNYDYKHALLLMFHGAELLLKQLLYLKNPIYIFDKNSLYKNCIDFINPTHEELLNCKSLDMKDLAREVSKYYSNQFTKSSLESIINSASKERNKLQHFATNTTEQDVISIILKLYHKVIHPSLKIIGKDQPLDSNDEYLKILNSIFSFWENANKTEEILDIEGKVFKRMICHECGQYSLFVLYEDNSGYPTNYYCSCCDNTKDSISMNDYYICPECDFYTLVYNPELMGGTCLNESCCSNKDGEVVIDMEYCDNCHSYKIEEICQCNKELDKEF